MDISKRLFTNACITWCEWSIVSKNILIEFNYTIGIISTNGTLLITIKYKTCYDPNVFCFWELIIIFINYNR